MPETKTEQVAVGKMEDGTVIELDMSKVLEKVSEQTKTQLEPYVKQLKEYYANKEDKDGKGLIEARLGPNANKLIEQFKNLNQADITEQWSVVIPNYTSKEIAGHIRDYVWITEVIHGKPGDTVYIPYVKDFDLTVSSTVGDACTEVTSILNDTSTTLKEGSAYTQVPYHTLEKYDQNLLDQLNSTFARAAVRCEDYVLMKALHDASSNTQYAGSINRSTYATAAFDADWIADAIGHLLAAGKDVKPGELVLWMHSKQYTALLKDIMGTQGISQARLDIIQKGLIEDFLGIKIVIGGLMPGKARTGTGTGTVYPAYLFRGKRCVALAPKREMLIETDRDIVAKKLKVACSHTFGVKVLDFKEAVRMLTNTRL